MKKKEFDETKVYQYFEVQLEAFMEIPYEELVSGYERFLKMVDDRCNHRYGGYTATFNLKIESTRLSRICAYNGALAMKDPVNPLTHEQVVEYFRAEYSAMKAERRFANHEVTLSEDGWSMIDQELSCRSFNTPDEWVEMMFLAEEYVEVLDSLDSDEHEILEIRLRNPNLKQKQIAIMLGLTDGGASRRMTRLKAKFIKLEARARRPKLPRSKKK